MHFSSLLCISLSIFLFVALAENTHASVFYETDFFYRSEGKREGKNGLNLSEFFGFSTINILSGRALRKHARARAKEVLRRGRSRAHLRCIIIPSICKNIHEYASYISWYFATKE